MILLQEFFSVVGVNRNVHDIPCFAILTNGTEKKPTLANPNIPPGALYLEHLHQIEKFEARSDIKVFILKKMELSCHQIPLDKFHQLKLF